MGNVISIEDIELYLKKNGMFNINVNEHIKNNNAVIQNLMYTTTAKLEYTTTLHHKMYNIIQQNNILNNYISYKNEIINKIISENKHLKKQKSKYIYAYKKKLSDAITSKQLENLVEFEIK